jgi:hypothetical protein
MRKQQLRTRYRTGTGKASQNGHVLQILDDSDPKYDFFYKGAKWPQAPVQDDSDPDDLITAGGVDPGSECEPKGSVVKMAPF